MFTLDQTNRKAARLEGLLAERVSLRFAFRKGEPKQNGLFDLLSPALFISASRSARHGLPVPE